jgi:hypothetical protein
LDGGLGTTNSIDIFAAIEGGGSLPTSGFQVTMFIQPLAGSTGSLSFAPMPSPLDQPNLSASSTNPITFDPSYPGQAYGDGTSSELTAISLTASGTVSFPGSNGGLFSAPLHIASGTSGKFQISFDTDIDYNGLGYPTGNPNNAYAFYPLGTSPTTTIEIFETIPGDADLSGTVDIADFTIWLNHFGGAGGWGDGNFTGVSDTDIDIADFTIWLNNFGSSVAPAPVAAVVPEPSALMLMCFGIPVWVRAKRLRKSANSSNLRGGRPVRLYQF